MTIQEHEHGRKRIMHAYVKHRTLLLDKSKRKTGAYHTWITWRSVSQADVDKVRFYYRYKL